MPVTKKVSVQLIQETFYMQLFKINILIAPCKSQFKKGQTKSGHMGDWLVKKNMFYMHAIKKLKT